MNLLSENKQQRAVWLFQHGFSIREVAHDLNVAKNTARRIFWLLGRNCNDRSERSARPGELACDYCDGFISGEREITRKTSRTKHAFCSYQCHADYRISLRENDSCSKCGITRKEIRESGKMPSMIKGHCAYCYGVLHNFNHDHILADSFIYNQQLKKEARQ